MKRNLFRGFAAVLAVGCMLSMGMSTEAKEYKGFSKDIVAGKYKPKERPKYVEGEAIVMYKKGMLSSSDITKQASSGISVKKTYSFDGDIQDETTKKGEVVTSGSKGYNVSVVSAKGMSTTDLIKALKSVEGIIAVEPNYCRYAQDITLNNKKDLLWAVDNQGQNGGDKGKDLKLHGADSLKTAEDLDEVVIAVLDTGIDSEFGDALWDNDYEPMLKGDYGFNFAEDYVGDGYTMDTPIDDNGHGTHCAGIINSVANKDGTHVKLMGLKFLDSDGEGDDEGVLAAYEYMQKAVSLGVNLVAVNNSWGGDGDSSIIDKIVSDLGKKGVISVFAAGNDSGNNDESGVSSNVESGYGIVVAASTEDDSIAEFSNYGKKQVDVAAPGTDILSTYAFPCFNPTIYNADEITKLTDYYQSFNGTEPLVDGKVNGEFVSGVPFSDDSKVSFSYDEDSYMSNLGDSKKDRSLRVSIKKCKSGEIHRFAIPFDASAESITEISLMMRQITDVSADFNMLEMGIIPASMLNDTTLQEVELPNILGGTLVYGNENYWTHFEMPVTDDSEDRVTDEENDMNLLVFELVCAQSGNYEFGIDDFAITSKEVTAEEFGKLEFLNGTSMATPYVTGAVGLISTKEEFSSKTEDPAEVALEKVGAMKGSVREEDEWQDKVSSSGVLDLSMLEVDEEGTGRKYQTQPVLYAISLEENQGIIKGVNLKNCVLEINGKAVESTVDENGKQMIFDGTEYEKCYISVVVTNTKSNKEATFDCFLAKSKEPNMVTSESVDGFIDNMVSDGEHMAIYSEEEGLLLFGTDEDDEDEGYNDYYDSGDDESEEVEEDTFDCESIPLPSVKEFKGSHLSESKMSFVSVMNGQMAFLNEKLYALLQVSGVATTGQVYSSETYLACYDFAEYKWTILTMLGEDNPLNDRVDNQTLAVYNGNVYVMGGYDYAKREMTNAVVVYHPKTGKWSKGVELIEGAMGGKAVQCGTKLVYLMGDTTKIGKNTESMQSVIVDANYVFNGKEWVKSTHSLESYQAQEVRYSKDQNTYYHVNCSLGLSGTGVLISGSICEKYGDLFRYTPSKDVFSNTDYCLSGFTDNAVLGTCIDGIWYGIESKLSSTYDDDYNFMDDMDDDGATVFYFDTESGFVHIPKNIERVKFTSSRKVYAPGEVVKFNVKASKGFTVGALKVKDKDGHYGSMKSGKVSMIATSNISVASKTIWKHIRSLKLDKTKATVKAGKKLKLKAKVQVGAPGNGYTYNKKVIWSSSNKKYATVDQKGTVTVKKAGASKKVKITAKAADGSGKKATCTIKIKK